MQSPGASSLTAPSSSRVILSREHGRSLPSQTDSLPPSSFSRRLSDSSRVATEVPRAPVGRQWGGSDCGEDDAVSRGVVSAAEDRGAAASGSPAPRYGPHSTNAATATATTTTTGGGGGLVFVDKSAAATARLLASVQALEAIAKYPRGGR